MLVLGWPLLAWMGTTDRMPAPAAVLLLTALFYATFTLVHEASHGLVVRGSALGNQLAGELGAIALLSRFNGFRQVHLRHHLHTNVEGKDPDLWSGSGPRWAAPLHWATSDINYWIQYDRSARLTPLAEWMSNGSLALLCAGVTTAIVSGVHVEFVRSAELDVAVALSFGYYVRKEIQWPTIPLFPPTSPPPPKCSQASSPCVGGATPSAT